MTAFKALSGDIAILQSNGAFYQSDLYSLNGQLFAKLGSGFVRLHLDGSTSRPKVSASTIVTDLQLYKDRFGRLAIEGGSGREALAANPLLGKE